MTEMPTRRPMTFSFLELLDRTFRLYRENFLTIVGLVAIVTVPITILNLLLNPASAALLSNQPTTFRATTGSSAAQLLLSILNLVQTVLIYAPITYIASEYLFNRKVSIGEAFSGASDRFTKVGCGLILMGFVIAIFAIAAAFVVAAFPPALALAGILVYIFVSASALMFPVLTLEDIGPSAAITRSYSLGKRRFWALVGVGVILAIIGALVGAILGGSATLLVLSVTPARGGGMVQIVLITFLTTLISIVITPLSPIAFTLLYYDIRVRSEGLDIMLDSSEGARTRPANFASPDSRFGLDGHDWRNVAILTVLGLVVGVLASGLIRSYIELYSRMLR